jgi:hypothetical protein
MKITTRAIWADGSLRLGIIFDLNLDLAAYNTY